MRLVYEQLALGDFELVRSAIEEYFAKEKDYKTNRYQLAPELRAAISSRWGEFIARYGYAAAAKDDQPAAPSAAPHRV
jgi:hypothetical protein